MTLSLALSGLQNKALGQKNNVPTKNSTFMITLTNPVSGIKVTFHAPAFVEAPLRESAWTKLTIHTPDDTFTIETPAQEGYMINSNDDAIWSPDGKYMSLYRVYSIRSKDSFSGMAIAFLDLELGERISFLTKNRLAVTTDNFQGWMKTKPHTALKRTAVTGKFEEAEPAF